MRRKARKQKIDAYRAAFTPLAVPLSRLLPTVERTVRWLSTRMPLAIVTSRTAAGAFQILDGFGLRRAFATVIGIEEVARPKPAPDPICLALERLGCPAARAVMVGDTPDDMQAGRAAGVGTIGVTSGHHGAEALLSAGADRVVGQLGQIVALLGGPSEW